MTHFKFIVFFLALFLSCNQKPATLNEEIVRVISIFENGEDTYFQDISIKILRFPANPITYIFRKMSSTRYAIFDTFPEYIIHKNFLKNPIDSMFVDKVAMFNHNEDVILLRLSNVKDKKIKIKVYDKMVYIYKGDKVPFYKLNADYVYNYSDWSYIIKPYDP